MLKIKIMRFSAGVLFFILCLYFFPYNWCSRDGDDWYMGDKKLHKKLSAGIEKWINSELSTKDYSTGSDTFSGEWLFGTYMMAAMGFGQSAVLYPETKDKNMELMNKCIEKMISQKGREFDTNCWCEDPIDSLDGDRHHAAYLGYLNLTLSLQRFIDPNSKYKELNDKITASLVTRLEETPELILFTYPGELYPVDNCSVIASIGLYDRATGSDHGELIKRWTKTYREKYISNENGLLYQAIGPDKKTPFDPGRGSGTAFGAYFLSFTDLELSRELYGALKKELFGTVLGFGAIREYPFGVSEGQGDIDSGPIVMGFGVSATGFTIADTRIHKDPETFKRLYATSFLFGAPVDREDRRDYIMGGPLGNCIMFAMLTASPVIERKEK